MLAIGHPIVSRLIFALMLVVLPTAAPQAAQRTLAFSDIAGDSSPLPGGGGDLVGMEVEFDDETGAYTITFVANPAEPFRGDIALTAHLINQDLLDIDPEHAEVHDDVNEFHLATPQTRIAVSGINTALTFWAGGHEILASNSEHHSTNEYGGPPVATIDDFIEGAAAIVQPAPPPIAPHLIRIDFSGEFARCIGPSPCTGTPLSELLGTPFSGSVTFPYTGVDTAADDSERGVYEFTSNASMSLVSAIPDLSLAEASPVDVLVSNCIGANCALNADYIGVQVRHAGFYFILWLATPRPPWSTDAIPTIEQLSGTYAAFQIATPDYSSSISIDSDNHPVDSPMSVSIYAVPLEIEQASEPRQIPALTGPWLAVLGILLTAVSIRSDIRRRRRA